MQYRLTSSPFNGDSDDGHGRHVDRGLAARVGEAAQHLGVRPERPLLVQHLKQGFYILVALYQDC